jgi:membrane protease subunit HflK
MAWRWLVRVTAALLLVAWLLTGVTEIRPGEVAVVRRFGRVLDVQPQPGLWVGFPWGIDRVDRVAVEQVRRVSVGYRPDEGVDRAEQGDTPPGQLLTGDHNLVNLQVVINYAVDPEGVVDYVLQRDNVEELLTRTAEAVLAEWAAGRPVDEVLQKGSTLLPAALLERLPPRLAPYRLGVRLRSVNVAPPSPPDEVKPAFDRVGQARAESGTRVQQARAEAQRNHTNAGIELRRMEDQTREYVTNVPKQARADAEAFETQLAAYRANPLVREIGRWGHLLRMMTKASQNGQLVPVDPSIKGPFPIIPAPK